MNRHTKYELIHCERCRAQFECKANSFTKCQCAKVTLTLNETQYVSENYEGCLCAECLVVVKEEYREMLNSGGVANACRQAQVGKLS